MVSRILRTTGLLFNRCNRGKLIIFLYFPITLILITIYTYGTINKPFSVIEQTGKIILLTVTIDVLFFYFMYVNNSVLTKETSFLYPLSNLSKMIHALSQIFYLRILYYIVPTLIVFISLITTGEIIGSIVFVVIYTINISLLHLIINIIPLVLPPKILNTNFPMFVFFTLMVLREIPSITKHYEIYAMYPISGWIGSATNYAINSHWGITAIYFCISIFLLLLASWGFQKLIGPQKRLWK